MVAAVNHFGNGALTDFVGLLWVVSYVGTCRCRVMYQQSAMPSRQGEEDHPPWHQSR